MSEMLTDLLQNIYGRISQLGKSINSLQESLDNLNNTINDKVETLVGSIKTMSEGVEREGETQQLIFQEIGDNLVLEVKRLQENVGLKDLDELKEKLEKIVQSSEDALRPETVDVLLHEVLTAVRQLTHGEGAGEDDDSLLDQLGSSLSGNPAGSKSDAPSGSTITPPPSSNPPPGNAPPGNPPPA